MTATKADIIAQLKKDILPLQGFKSATSGHALDVGLGPLKYAFPNAVFPLGVIHEFICTGNEGQAATSGFIAGVLSTLMRINGSALWISSSLAIFPPALKCFGIEPDKIIFVNVKNEIDILWIMEEALKCSGLAAVIGEMQEIGFTASRRLQLAVEQSRVTGFVIRNNPRKTNTTACVTRWKITPIPDALPGDMPGLGFPRWNVELIKIRNGRPGTWQMEWMAGRFRHISLLTSIPHQQRKKTG